MKWGRRSHTRERRNTASDRVELAVGLPSKGVWVARHERSSLAVCQTFAVSACRAGVTGVRGRLMMNSCLLWAMSRWDGTALETCRGEG